MDLDKWILLGRLRRAVRKIRFLLNFNLNRWRLASMIGTASGKRRLSFSDRPGLIDGAASGKNRLSFNDRPGLIQCADDLDLSDDSPCSSQGRSLSRTSSCPSEDDINKKADIFISNFYRQLQLERQISLDLRYCRGDSVQSLSPSPRWGT
ncbi:hypothetical protein NMG60_11005736 [Bertholletia excelsa]